MSTAPSEEIVRTLFTNEPSRIRSVSPALIVSSLRTRLMALPLTSPRDVTRVPISAATVPGISASGFNDWVDDPGMISIFLPPVISRMVTNALASLITSEASLRLTCTSTAPLSFTTSDTIPRFTPLTTTGLPVSTPPDVASRTFSVRLLGSRLSPLPSIMPPMRSAMETMLTRPTRISVEREIFNGISPRRSEWNIVRFRGRRNVMLLRVSSSLRLIGFLRV